MEDRNASFNERAANVWFVTSVIEPTKKSLSYSGSRSYFTKDERLNQTKEGILSIQKNYPEARIVLLEGSKRDFSNQFNGMGIEVVHFGKMFDQYIIRSPFKGLGEAYMLLSSASFSRHAKKVNKISGRYLISTNNNNADNLVAFSSNKAITILYSMQRSTYIEWLIHLETNFTELSKGLAIEEALTSFVAINNLAISQELGVEGLNGITGGLGKF
jgi:hypothetical protein